jgi:hypothetical protein
MILAPLSPRNAIAMPCSYTAVKQRDKQKLGKVIRQRTTAASLGLVSMPQLPKENCHLARRPGVDKRMFTSITSIKRTFYWGADRAESANIGKLVFQRMDRCMIEI